MSNAATAQPAVCHRPDHETGSAFRSFGPAAGDLIRAGSRRWFLQAGLAGFAGVSSATLARAMESATGANAGVAGSGPKKSVILFWLSGGPSHIDMWDPKPDAPSEIRGPFRSIETKVPGLRLSEHLPLQASIADKISFVRSVDCKTSNHTPITMQAGNPYARRTDNSRDGDGWPSMGSVAARYKGSNHPDMPAFAAIAPSMVADVYGAGQLGEKYAPVEGLKLVGKFGLPEGVQVDRLQNREALRSEFDRFRKDLDRATTHEQTDRFTRQAYEMVAGGYVQRAFDMSGESDATRDLYGRNSIGEKAILARRLIEAGTTFTVVSGSWGYFDNHGDHIPPWGGIVSGLKPLIPQADRAFYGLVTDLEQRGLLDSTLVIMMGEFGRSPALNVGAGRDHWLNCMSLIMAGGGLRHGQAVGATDSRGYDVKDGLVRPQDLAATVFRHLDIDLGTHWVNPSGRPTPIVVDGGRPIPELT